MFDEKRMLSIGRYLLNYLIVLRAASRPNLIATLMPGKTVPTASAPISNRVSFSRTPTTFFLISPLSALSYPVSPSNSTTCFFSLAFHKYSIAKTGW
jgi:hypothetical protein